MKKNYTAAIENYLQALKFEPNDEWTHVQIGKAYGKTKQRNKVREHYQILLKMKSTYAKDLKRWL